MRYCPPRWHKCNVSGCTRGCYSNMESLARPASLRCMIQLFENIFERQCPKRKVRFDSMPLQSSSIQRCLMIGADSSNIKQRYPHPRCVRTIQASRHNILSNLKTELLSFSSPRLNGTHYTPILKDLAPRSTTCLYSHLDNFLGERAF